MINYSDEYFMKIAIKEALKAEALNEIPVGCIITKDNKIIARGYNKRENDNNSLAHAEIIAINKACKKLNSWRLDGCKMYITLEPCIMCSGAIIQSRIDNLIYGAKDERFGCYQSFLNIFDYKFNHHVNVKSNILEEECSLLIKNFFKKLRNK